MSYCFNLISHPDRTLAEHLDRCNEISEKLLDMKYLSGNFFKKEELNNWRKIINYFHDCGKSTDFFQTKIIEATLVRNIESFVDQNKEYLDYFVQNKLKQAKRLLADTPELSHHARLGAYMVLSNQISDDEIVNIIVQKVILKHHGNQSNLLRSKEDIVLHLDEDRIKTIEKQLEYLPLELYSQIIEKQRLTINPKIWDEIKTRYNSLRYFNKLEKNIKQADTSKYFFLHQLLYSLLLSADKGDMMLEKEKETNVFLHQNISIPTEIVDNYKSNEFKGTKIKPIDIERENAYKAIVENCIKYSTNNFFSITLPTGLGKTFAAYNAAIQLQNSVKTQTGTTPRIIYCLPFTSIIDQNSQIITSIFKHGSLPETLIAKHHYLSSLNDYYDSTELTYESSEYLTEGWEQDFIVTTFVQLFESIFTNKNRSLRKFHNILNSIIILDEVQNVPPKYYKAIEYIFTEMANLFNVKVILVTATQPVIFSKEILIELTDKDRVITKKFFENRERITLNQALLKENNYKPIDIDKVIEIIEQDIKENPDKSFLIICNTIAQSQQVFLELQNYIQIIENETITKTKMIYLSGSVLPKRRKQLIQLIKRNLKYNYRQIIVSTQVVEAGVDIDLDIVYRDFAPLDSINQSAGRCNRNGIKGKGVVKLFDAGKAKFIYDDTLLNITENILKSYPENIEEKQFYELSNQYFEKIYKSISEFSDAASEIIGHVKCLELEDLHKKFKLIKEENYYYDVFIPYQKAAIKVWNEYIDCYITKKDFERKRAIKLLKPKLLQYVTRFPKNYFQPNDNQKDKSLIKVDDWPNYYDLNSGFKRTEGVSII